MRIPVGRGFAGRDRRRAARSSIEDVDHADILNPILREKGIRSLLGVPLLVSGRVLGVLHVGSLTPRDFTADDSELLQLAADRAAIAIEHAQLFEQRRDRRDAPAHLLPQELPAIAGLEVASRYLPAEGTSLGGDWYDVFELPGGRDRARRRRRGRARRRWPPRSWRSCARRCAPTPPRATRRRSSSSPSTA